MNVDSNIGAPPPPTVSGPPKSQIVLPPLSAEARRLLLAVVFVAGLAELSYVIVNLSAMPIYIKAIGLDPRWVGAATTAYLVIEGVLKSPFGVLGDRVGRKSLILLGPIISAVTAFLTPWVHHPYALVSLRFMDGLGAAALWPSAFSLIGDHVPEQRRASAMSLFNVAYISGVAIGPFIGGTANEWAFQHMHISFAASKSASFYVAAALFALTAAVAFFVIPNTAKVGHDPADLGPGVEEGFSLHAFVRMLRSMPTALLMAFTTFLGTGLVMAYAKLFIMERYHVTERQYGALLIVPALIIAASSIPLGATGDRIGNARAVRLGIALCTTAFWTLFVLNGIVSLVIMGSLIGIGFVIAFPAWMAQVSSACDSSQRGAAVGAVGTAQGLGAILGVAVSGFLYSRHAQHIGSIVVPAHGIPFLGCGVMLFISLLLSFTRLTGRTVRPC